MKPIGIGIILKTIENNRKGIRNTLAMYQEVPGVDIMRAFETAW
jgi:hypothetical protein